jgi:hypothetical protein
MARAYFYTKLSQRDNLFFVSFFSMIAPRFAHVSPPIKRPGDDNGTAIIAAAHTKRSGYINKPIIPKIKTIASVSRFSLNRMDYFAIAPKS